MKENSLFKFANLRTVTMCLAVVCSTIASWADPVVGETFTYEGIQYTVKELVVGNVNGNVSVAIPQTLTGDIKIPARVVMTEKISETEGRVWIFDVKEFDLSQMTISDNLTSLTVDNPNYSISIPNNCFQKKSIKTISISGGVSSLGNGAFSSCANLTSVTFGKNSTIKEIPEECFDGCTSLASIAIPSTVTSIGEKVFKDCESLSSIEIPSSVTSISGYAFQGCKSLSSVTIPNSVTSIGNNAFSACVALSSITIPNSVISIGDYAFSNTSLSSITIPSGVTSIGAAAFGSCYKLANITISNSVTSIGDNAFSECTSLSSVKIPDSVTSIGKAVFANCTSLSSVTISNKVTSISEYAFSECDNLSSVEMPSSVTSIDEAAFSFCYQLTNITIPNSVTSISKWAFYDCPLTQVTCKGTTPPVCDSEAFFCVDMSNCKLIVPKDGAEKLYREDAVWGQFSIIEPSGVEDVTIDDNAVEVERYNINGEKLSAPQVGINIVKMSDGSVKKVVVNE